MLSCTCDHHYGEGWHYYPPHDFSRLESKKRKRCCSCGHLIDKMAECLSFRRCRTTESDIEERIYGGEVPLSPWFMCEQCGEIYLNLSEIGYCINLNDNMNDLLIEYWNIVGFKPPSNNQTKGG